MCFFQELSALDSWWAPVASKHGFGFSASILFSFACRAMVDPQLGRRSSDKHDQSEPETMYLGSEEENGVNTFYCEIGELCSEPGWGYDVPACAHTGITSPARTRT